MQVKNFFLASTLIFLTVSIAFAQPTSPKNEEKPPANDAEYEQQYQERIKKDKIAGVYIPKNLEEACQQLSKLSTPEAQTKFKAVPEDSVPMYFHSKLGMWIIMNWSFYEGSRLSHYFRTAGVTYPDDMADLVMVAWHRHLNGKPLETKQLIVFYKEKRMKKYEQEQINKQKKAKVIHEEKRKRN